MRQTELSGGACINKCGSNGFAINSSYGYGFGQTYGDVMELMVEVKNLTKLFGDNLVLDDISLDVKVGENAVVFGRSGTGKSVLLKCIVKLLIPEAGEIIVDGKNVYKIKEKD